MYFLKKCAQKGCKRTGNVALLSNDTYCNLHSKESVSATVEVQITNKENRDENGARIE